MLPRDPRDYATKARRLFSQLALRHRTPRAVQDFISGFAYNREQKGETLHSAYWTLKLKRAHCLEASFVAATILEHWGYPPLVLSLESQDDLDHVVFAFKKGNLWGTIGRSRDPGLQGRRPVFKSIESLVDSYLDPYVDRTGRITGYAIAHLDDSWTDWRYSDTFVWKTEQYLIDFKHRSIKMDESRYQKALKLYLAKGAHPVQPSWW